jgi:hypothetical protein
MKPTTSQLGAFLCVLGVLCGQTGCNKKATSVVLDTTASAQEKAPDRKRPSGEAFAFPKDEAGRLLAATLPPSGGASARPERRSEPRRPAGPRSVEQPDISLPLASVDGSLPRTGSLKQTTPLRPRLLPSEAPWTRQALEPTAILPDGLPVAPLARVPSPDVEKSQPVPILSQAVSDRASLEDPTALFSLEAVLATQAPERASPAPVWFLNLPDPFEFHHVAKLRTPLPEDNVLP